LKMRSIFIFLTAFLIIGLSLGQNAANNSSTQNIAAPGNTSPENASSLQNANAAKAAENATPAIDLSYIWSVGGIEAGQITMVLNQDGDNLFGQAKYEPENGQPWNGDVTGSVSGDKIALVITAAKDKKLVSNKLDGVFDNASQTIQGKFVQMSEGKIVGNGEFNAMWISPDVSGYNPAKIEEPKLAAAETSGTASNQTETQPSKPKSRFVDVREYKDKIGPGGDLSGVPPGMGGSIGA
jgi:hypothetical protein